MSITELLIQEYGFKKIIQCSAREGEPIDYDRFSCVLRVHEIHYLFWSEEHKYFSIGVKHNNPKGLAGGGIKHWTFVMIPKPIYKIEEAVNLINSTISFEYLKTIIQ